ncbi:MAG: hypothetical protein HKN47_00845 [Pirellulaceae bacterium]|nr:hypothetical protein [Pirellulaceae bacterium]
MAKTATIDSRHYVTCLWPGLTELWWRGRLSGLPSAIVFAVALNLLLVTRFLYPQWVSGFLVHAALWIGLGAWVFFVIRSVRELPLLLAPRTVSEQPDQFDDAQEAYLQADWDQAERLLMGVLAIEPRDPPALLLLSGVYRHTERAESAKMVVTELKRLEIGDSWSLEIQAEMSRIDRELEHLAATEQESTSSGQKSVQSAADLTAA